MKKAKISILALAVAMSGCVLVPEPEEDVAPVVVKPKVQQPKPTSNVDQYFDFEDEDGESWT